MNTTEFNLLFEETINICRRTLCEKADEYADGEDRLHNFNVAAVIQDETPVKSLGGMGIKHYVSIYDLIRRHEKGVKISDEMWTEKIKDGINYLILLRAALYDSSHAVKDADKTAEHIQCGTITHTDDSKPVERVESLCISCYYCDIGENNCYCTYSHGGTCPTHTCGFYMPNGDIKL